MTDTLEKEMADALGRGQPNRPGASFRPGLVAAPPRTISERLAFIAAEIRELAAEIDLLHANMKARIGGDQPLLP